MPREPFVHELWLIFAVTGAGTVLITAAIRFLFRRKLGITELEPTPTTSRP